MEQPKTYVISLGGSLIAPAHGEYNFDYIAQLRKIVKKDVDKNASKYIIIVGGGKNARHSQEQLRSYYKKQRSEHKLSDHSLDWVGILATRNNAQFVKECFGAWAHPILYSDLDDEMPIFEKVLFGGGWKPGRSTDFCAMQHAVNLELLSVINLSNIDYVYDKDPNQAKDAKPYKTITWSDYRDKIPANWQPGANAPFDPEASRLAQSHAKAVKIISSDAKLGNLQAALFSDDFDGTTIGANATRLLQK